MMLRDWQRRHCVQLSIEGWNIRSHWQKDKRPALRLYNRSKQQLIARMQPIDQEALAILTTQELEDSLHV